MRSTAFSFVGNSLLMIDFSLRFHPDRAAGTENDSAFRGPDTIPAAAVPVGLEGDPGYPAREWESRDSSEPSRREGRS